MDLYACVIEYHRNGEGAGWREVSRIVRKGNHEKLFIIKSIKRELKTRPIYDCRCDERLKPKDDEST
jgi:hypothetical protein